MSKSKHESDDLNLKSKHHRAKKDTEGGRCLVPYGSYAQQSCSYRYQAYERALKEPKVYNWDKYKSVGSGQKTIVLVRQRRAAKGEKRWEKKQVKVPKQGEWDVSRNSSNFQRSCNKPYWFEAHHLIPHSQLRTAIDNVEADKPNGYKMRLVVRRGLLEEGYNLNHMINMMILPMDRLVAEALELPKHVSSPDHWDHSDYSDHVEEEIKKFFNPVLETKSKHQTKIKYRPVMEKLENLSARLRKKIKQLGKRLWAKQGDVTLNDVNPTKQKGLGGIDV